MKLSRSPFFASTAIAVVGACLAPCAGAVTVLGSNFAGVDKTDVTAPFTATNITWDTVNGINTPAGDLTFTIPGGGDVVGLHNKTAGEIDVNNNMTAGGWQTSIPLVLDGSASSIDLASLDYEMRLTNNSGNDNTTGSKSGRMTVELIGSVSGSLGLVDDGNSGYASVIYNRSIDLSGLPSLDTSETYTLVLSALGVGFGHHKSLRDLQLLGELGGGPSLPGDTDGDGDIDDSDLGTSFANYTGPVGNVGKTAADGDTDGDGDVDDSDLGTSFSGYTGPLGPASVPEPTSLALLGLGGLLIVRRRRAGVI